MATSSLTVIDLDAKKPRAKKTVRAAAPKKRAVKAAAKPRAKKTAAPAPAVKEAEVKVVKENHAHAHDPLPPMELPKTEKQKREPLGHLLVEHLLKEAGFRGVVTSDKRMLDRYSNDESIFTIRPQIVLQPKSQKDIEIAVRVLGRETLRFPSLSLTPRAAGTGLGGGSLTDSVVIDVCAFMHRIHDVVTKKDKSTITCEPGAMWRDVAKRLKGHGLYLPSYPASMDICSIGGSVANNAAGPDSLRYGHTAKWVESLDVTLYDGKTYTVAPITHKEYKALIKKDNAYGNILKAVFELVEQNEKHIHEAKPKTTKNSSGYALWDIFTVPIASFKKGKGFMDLTQLFCGSQGTIGIITSVTLRTEPIRKDTELVAIPVFDLQDAGRAIIKALEYDPINIELFDGLTFDLALKNPDFFRDRLGKLEYYQVLLSLYTTYHVRYGRKTPEFTLLITLDSAVRKHNGAHLVDLLRKNGGKKARLVTNPVEREMLWQVRRASYSLSKLLDPSKRPAAFLEDMVVPAKNMPKFFMEIKRLLKKYNVTAAVHGHGGNGHLHFYPLLDFTNKTTPALVMKMTEEFFATAVKFDGNLCGEHNDGIIRTPHLSKMFSPKTIALFKEVEHICDPNDIFNPGKKVNPRFDVRASIRTTNTNTGAPRTGKEVAIAEK
jgi:FAD/FMN-containing dehydrogenase